MLTDNNKKDIPKGNNNKNSTKFALLAGILAIGLVAASIAGSQALSATAQQQNSTDDDPMPVDIGCETGAEFCEEEDRIHSSTVSTSGTATTKVQPDKFSVTVGVETNGTTAQEAASRNSDHMAQVVAALQELGIAESDISTSNYNVYPVYEYREPAEVCIEIYPQPPECQPKNEITGYRAVNSVTVTLDVDGDVEAGQVIDSAIVAGANNVNGVYFFNSSERQEEIRHSLIAEAIENAKRRAEVAAEAVDMTVSGVHSINLNDAYFPVYSRGLDAAAGAESAQTQILPGEQEVSTTVTIVFYINDRNNSNGSSEASGSFGMTEPAMEFILSKLPELGIEISSEMDVVMDMVPYISDTEIHYDFSVVDVGGAVHNGHIEVIEGVVTVAELDGQSIL